MFKDLNATVTNLVLSMAVVHDLLLSKKVVTNSEITAASEKIRAEAKDALAKIPKTGRRGPNGGTQ
jgi:methionine-rich copper-binding protein CopC